MRNLDAVFKHDCTEDACCEVTKRAVGVQSDGSKFSKRYVCENTDCPKKMSYLTKLGLPENRFRS